MKIEFRSGREVFMQVQRDRVYLVMDVTDLRFEDVDELAALLRLFAQDSGVTESSVTDESETPLLHHI